MNDLEKKSIECIKNMPIEETTYQVARNVVLDYITNLQQENERLNQDLSYYQRYGADMLYKNNILEERIEKAVEYGNICINKDLDLETLDEPYKTTFKTAYEIHNNYLDILLGRSDE